MSDRKFRHEDGVSMKRGARSQQEMTPMEFMNWLNEVISADGTDPLISPGVYIDWYSPKTPEEEAADLMYEQQKAERTEKWERETYARLYAKYGHIEAPEEGFNWP